MAGGLEAAGESMDETASDAAGLSLALRGVKSQADEAGDKLIQAGAKATATGGAFAALTAGTEGLNLSFGTLSTTTTLSLIPALATLSTMLAPLAAAFGVVAAGAGSLAVAFGGLLGVGVLSWGRQLADQMEGVNSATEALARVASGLAGRLADVLAPLGRSFVPLLQDAVIALPRVVEEMVAAVGSTEEFRQAMAGFGSVAARVLPAATGFIFDLARRALPVARDFFNFLLTEGVNAWDAIMASVQELAPEWNAFLNSLVEASGPLLRFGTHVGEVVLPALTGLVNVATGFMETINGLPGVFRGAAISAMILAPALVSVATVIGAIGSALTGAGGLISLIGGGGATGLGGALVSLATGPVGLAVLAIGALATAWATNFAGIQTKSKRTVDVIKDHWDNLRKDLSKRQEGLLKGAAKTVVLGAAPWAKWGIDPLLNELGWNDSSEPPATYGGRPDNRPDQTAADAITDAFEPPSPTDIRDDLPEWYQKILSEAEAEESGEQAGRAAARGFATGLQQHPRDMRAQMYEQIRQQEMRLKELRDEFRNAESLERKREIQDRMQDLVNPGDINLPRASELGPTRTSGARRAFMTTGGSGASAESTSVRGAAASAMPSTSGDTGLPSTGLGSLETVVSKLDSTVDRLASAVKGLQQIRVTGELRDEDGELVAVIDDRIDHHHRGQQRDYDVRRGGPHPGSR